jgi:hypothetical protein
MHAQSPDFQDQQPGSRRYGWLHRLILRGKETTMGNIKARAACPQFEVMEGRLVLSPAPLGGLAVHAAAVQRATFIHLLTPQLRGTNISDVRVDPRTGVVQIQGTVTLPPDFSANNPGVGGFAFNVTVNQAVGRLHSVTGTATALVGLPSTPQAPVSFTVRLTATNGRFGRGYATVSLPDYSTGSSSSYVPTAQWLAWLRRDRLS